MTTLAEYVQQKTLSEIAGEAIAHALAGRWEQAAASNAEAVRMAPSDAGSYNRQARALLELGRYAEARGAAEAALKLRPGNAIARRHLDRISHLQASGAVRRAGGATPVARPAAFIADRARSTVTELRNPAPANVLATASPGDPLTLSVGGGRLRVITAGGRALGNLETRLAQHLRRLVQGGNRYEVAAARVTAGSVAVIVRETHRSTKQAQLVSFPLALQKYSAVRVETDLEEDRGELLDGGSAGSGPDVDDEDVPQPGEAQTERLRAILSRDSSDDVIVPDDAQAV